MKRGDRIEVEVAALTAKGDGLAYVGQREVVVRQSVRVAARVVKKRPGCFEAEVEDARRNAGRNRIEHCEFMVGAVEGILGELAAQGRRFDLAVVDPPRPGIHKKALAGLCALAPPRIMYVSCNAHALAGDLRAFGQAGQPVDMFPQTPHCEGVVELYKQVAG